MQAKQSLQELLNSDPFLQQRAGPVEIKVMQKSAYSVYRCASETDFYCLLQRNMRLCGAMQVHTCLSILSLMYEGLLSSILYYAQLLQQAFWKKGKLDCGYQEQADAPLSS